MADKRQVQGIVCQECGCRHFLVVWTRPRGDAVERQRQCRNCGKRVRTKEKVTAV